MPAARTLNTNVAKKEIADRYATTFFHAATNANANAKIVSHKSNTKSVKRRANTSSRADTRVLWSAVTQATSTNTLYAKNAKTFLVLHHKFQNSKWQKHARNNVSSFLVGVLKQLKVQGKGFTTINICLNHSRTIHAASKTTKNRWQNQKNSLLK